MRHPRNQKNTPNRHGLKPLVLRYQLKPPKWTSSRPTKQSTNSPLKKTRSSEGTRNLAGQKRPPSNAQQKKTRSSFGCIDFGMLLLWQPTAFVACAFLTIVALPPLPWYLPRLVYAIHTLLENSPHLLASSCCDYFNGFINIWVRVKKCSTPRGQRS